MKAKVGQYYFGRHRNIWGVWVYDVVDAETGYTSGKFIKDCVNYEDAVREMYALNGWRQPSTISKKF